jgi:hypothetical protein
MNLSESFTAGGFDVCRGVFDIEEIEALRVEADVVAAAAGSACVRHLRSRSHAFEELSTSSRLLGLLPRGLRPVRSILFDKTPDENWPVAWHQDLTIAVAEEQEVPGYGPWSIKDGHTHVQPPLELLAQMMTIRVHLDDTPEANGALRVIPGSHKSGKLSGDVVREIDKAFAVTCECRAGDVLLMSPLIVHSSRRSTRPMRRRVIHFEYAREEALDSRLRWLER